MTLGEYLHRAGGMVRQSAVHDCCAFPAGWAIECGHSDPMRRWRERYTTDAEGEDLIFDAGGLAVLFDEGMAEAGIPIAEGEPQAGDIGVISINDEEAGAIFTGRRWAFAADRGIVCASIDPACAVRVWRP